MSIKAEEHKSTNGHALTILNVPLDCMKITSLEEVKFILDSLDLNMSSDCKYYEQLKHLKRE